MQERNRHEQGPGALQKGAGNALSAGLLIAMFLLVSTLAFGLGRLSAIEESTEPVSVQYDFTALGLEEQDNPYERIDLSVGTVVGSENGNRYHLPWCPSAGRINAENRVVFSNRAEAEAAGYSPAQNCPGL